MHTLFYHSTLGSIEKKPTIDVCYRTVVWRPHGFDVIPKGLPLFPYAAWSAFHVFHVFHNRGYFLFLIYHEDDMVHRSCVIPGFYRYPFMQKNDVQVGYVWTREDHRGKGLAEFALKTIVSEYVPTGSGVWYLTYKDNFQSIRVAEKAGFSLVGTGMRTRPLGLYVAGRFVLSGPESGRSTRCE